MIRLKPHREGPVLGGHPWLFSGAVATVRTHPADGETVRIENTDGAFVGWGLFNSRSQIRVRVYSLREEEPLTDEFWRNRIMKALDWRSRLPEPANRMIASEADGLSGLTVDRYNDNLVVQFTALGLAQRREIILDALQEALCPKGMWLRTEQGIREEEGLEITDGVLRGEPDSTCVIRENGLDYEVNLAAGQKTGFYHDQRDNRLRAATFAKDRRCLDVCCYSGGFALNLARAGASGTIGVDASASALEIAARNAERNGLIRIEWRKGDAFSVLPSLREAGEKFGLIVLDPPKFTRSKGSEAQAIKGYASLNEMALRILEPGGILVTCSCSGRITREVFRETLNYAGQRAGRFLRLLEQRGASPDHPVNPACPETEYLKCFILQVD
jgi:23S rRNA (cytosine1962-C5)-methyltransferase